MRSSFIIQQNLEDLCAVCSSVAFFFTTAVHDGCSLKSESEHNDNQPFHAVTFAQRDQN